MVSCLRFTSSFAMMLHRTRAAAACSSSRAVAPVRRPHRHLHHTLRASGPAERSARPEDEANSAGGFNSRKGPVSLDRRQLLNIGEAGAPSIMAQHR